MKISIVPVALTAYFSRSIGKVNLANGIFYSMTLVTLLLAAGHVLFFRQFYCLATAFRKPNLF
jgi:hypothetical protein